MGAGIFSSFVRLKQRADSFVSLGTVVLLTHKLERESERDDNLVNPLEAASRTVSLFCL